MPNLQTWCPKHRGWTVAQYDEQDNVWGCPICGYVSYRVNPEALTDKVRGGTAKPREGFHYHHSAEPSGSSTGSQG